MASSGSRSGSARRFGRSLAKAAACLLAGAGAQLAVEVAASASPARVAYGALSLWWCTLYASARFGLGSTELALAALCLILWSVLRFGTGALGITTEATAVEWLVTSLVQGAFRLSPIILDLLIGRVWARLGRAWPGSKQLQTTDN